MRIEIVVEHVRASGRRWIDLVGKRPDGSRIPRDRFPYWVPDEVDVDERVAGIYSFATQCESGIARRIQKITPT